MSKLYRIRYKFSFENINDDIINKSIEYWESRKFKYQYKNKEIVGNRGNTFGNLFSFDMTKLICKLQVEFLENNISVEFTINSKFQILTDVNLASFKIEQLLFPYYLKNERYPEFLYEFMTFNNDSAVKWVASFMVLG